MSSMAHSAAESVSSQPDRPERSRNAKAQARHRAKRKAYIEQVSIFHPRRTRRDLNAFYNSPFFSSSSRRSRNSRQHSASPQTKSLLYPHPWSKFANSNKKIPVYRRKMKK